MWTQSSGGPGSSDRMKLRVLVRLKPGILDVQGAAVKRALDGLGFSDLHDLRIGKVVDLDVDAPTDEAARHRVDEMCKKLLANPILEDYTIEIVSDLAAPRSER
jgi:phosphoribosylformylglycinamidine synthase subunit PurS